MMDEQVIEHEPAEAPEPDKSPEENKGELTTDPLLDSKVAEIVERGAAKDIGFNFGNLAPQNFGDIIKFADYMGKSQCAVGPHLRGNTGACLAVTMRALNWGMEPFAVASQSYLVTSRGGDQQQIAFSAQMLAAVVIKNAPIIGRPSYDIQGEGADLKVTCLVQLKEGGTADYTTPKFSEIKIKNSPLWQNDPVQQMCYYAVRGLTRRHFPDILLGAYDTEEMKYSGPDHAKDITPATNPLEDDADVQATG